MKRILSVALLLCFVTVFITSCKKSSENANHIPKDATAVLRVDMGAIGKKLAMDILFGSDIFKQMSENAGKDSSNMKDIQNAGIDFLNTFYVYVTSDKRYSGDQHVVGLIPLSDDAKWEAYVKKTSPKADIKSVGKRKECLLDEGMYAAWDANLLVLTNTITKEQEMPFDENGNYIAPETDMVQTAAEVDNIFQMSKDNSITSNKRYASMEKDGKDINIWVNYENIMNNYGRGMMGGLTMSNAMMKDAVMVTGIDFNKGAVDADMKYYVSDDMKGILKDLGNNKVNKELVERLPANNLNALAVISFSSKAMKDMLEKFGLLGMINVGLQESGLNADDVFQSFTGDMGFALNNFRLESSEVEYMEYNEAGEVVPAKRMASSPAMDWIYVLKIDKQEKFDKILQFGTTAGMLVSTGNGTYTIANAGQDAPQLIVKDNYLVASNTVENANAFIAGTNKGQKLHEVAAKEIYDHPMSMFFDIQKILTAVESGTKDDAKDAARVAELKKTFDNVIFTGGEFKDDAFTYKASLNFVNKNENSLMQIIDLSGKMSQIDEQQDAVAVR